MRDNAIQVAFQEEEELWHQEHGVKSKVQGSAWDATACDAKLGAPKTQNQAQSPIWERKVSIQQI